MFTYPSLSNQPPRTLRDKIDQRDLPDGYDTLEQRRELPSPRGDSGPFYCAKAEPGSWICSQQDQWSYSNPGRVDVQITLPIYHDELYTDVSFPRCELSGEKRVLTTNSRDTDLCRVRQFSNEQWCGIQGKRKAKSNWWNGLMNHGQTRRRQGTYQ